MIDRKKCAFAVYASGERYIGYKNYVVRRLRQHVPGVDVVELDMAEASRLIHLEEAHIRVEHRSELEYRIADRQSIHIDKQNFIILKFEILCVIISVNHMIVLRNSLYEFHQFFTF